MIRLPLVIVGNKSDLGVRQVNRDAAIELAKKFKGHYLECTAKDYEVPPGPSLPTYSLASLTSSLSI